MERLHLKVSRLETLWSCLGTCIDSLSINEKLEHVLYELDKVIEYEEWRKLVLSADIEDVMASIEHGCDILGIAMESLLTTNMNDTMTDNWEFFATNCVMTPTLDRKKTLTTLNNRLANEIRQRRLHVKEWLQEIDTICLELGQSHSLGSYHDYYDDLSWGTVQKVSCTLRDLTQKQTSNKVLFEQLVHSIHYFWTVLDEPIHGDDPIDISLHQLCSTINNHHFHMDNIPHLPLDKHNMNNNAFLYYRHPLPFPLSLQDDLMMVLQSKAHDLEALYNNRLERFNHFVESIQTLWEELNVPESKKCTIHRSLHEENMIKLQIDFDQMKTIVRTMTDEYLDTIRQDLVHLWDECLLTQYERDEFMSILYHKANTMDTVRSIIDEHMSYLKAIQPASHIVSTIMKERKDLIQKMIDFETSASDPKRLFQASFQLLEEERWRKTCFPTLLQLDDTLTKAVQDFERISEKHFMVGNRRFLDILKEEIMDRTANQTFFGFLNTEPNHDRSTRVKPRHNSSICHSLSINTNNNKKSKTTIFSESPTQDMPSNDIQPRRNSNSHKQRSSPTGNNKQHITNSIVTTDPPLPSTTLSSSSSAITQQLSSSSSKFLNQISSSHSTRTKHRQDIKKRRSTQSIPTSQEQTMIIPEQHKSKSYPVSGGIKKKRTTLFDNDTSIPNHVENNHIKNNNQTTITNDDTITTSTSQLSPPISPLTPRTKASQIPVRAQPPSNRASVSPSPARQQRMPVQCA
ncbi:microtubule associated protein-domain-containing protein [Halteromyces radiatus]|uniref:microtubule associated protein-domain-containing protein n=1 Tax=Halteromyces radiatus TaxID=101107 RepID=UPI00221FCD27|nr:microtubule associated protein-domain-containing protein [Halteromyces radiatus]KAI8082703.1 microtubule associated protein-domain-containing protein [Halteromyces radiatus]